MITNEYIYKTIYIIGNTRGILLLSILYAFQKNVASVPTTRKDT